MSDAPRIAPELADLPHVPVTALEPLQGNLKELTKREYAKLKKSILDYGLIVPFFVWAEAGRLLDGHQRQRVMLQEGWELDVPVVYISATDEQDAKRKLLVVSSQYGRVSQEGWDDFTWDLDDDWLTETVHFDALSLVFGDWEPDPEPPAGADAEPQVNRAEELREEWGTQPGQLWRLPSRVEGQEHRLICGDCTDGAVVERLMGGDVPLLMVTDPPYGVEHDTSWREAAGISRMGEQSAKGIEWDSNDNWQTAYEMGGADVAFVWHADTHNLVVAQSLVAAGYELKQMIVWAKTVAPFGRAYYSHKHEPCWYAVRKGKTANWSGPNNEVTVWETASPRHIMGGSDEEKTPHPTQKPIMLYERPITNHTKAGDIVYEPFSGSGTALIACENLVRQCRAIEISPAYTAVALQRFFDAFGVRPELVESS